jgi:heat-inducible transcriptional repressor
MVLVLVGGTVKQQMLTLDEVVEQEALSRLSNEINDKFRGRRAGEVEHGLRRLSEASRGVGAFVLKVVGQLMAAQDRQGDDALYRDGLLHILQEPEFALGGQAREIVQAIEGPSLNSIVTTAAPVQIGGVQVLIGGEGRWHEFTDLALVLSRYGVEGGASGLLGVVGPLRMTYDRTIGAVRYVAGLMSDLVGEWYDVGERAAGGQPDAGPLPAEGGQEKDERNGEGR